MTDAFNFFVVTDTHYFENSLGAEGSAYEARSATDQKCIAESGAIIDAGFKKLREDDFSDTIIIVGDLIFNAEIESHKTMVKKLDALRQSGKKIYVVTARHDYGDDAYAFRGDERISVEGTPKEKLRELYYDYGFKNAVSEHRQTLSYVAQLTENVRLIAINCDGDKKQFRGLYDEQMQWITEQIKAAHDAGCFIFGMMHYPLLPGTPVMEMTGGDSVLTGWRVRAQQLADAGLPLIFTGHMHMQSLNTLTTPAGNTITDICTGCFVGCPLAYRKVSLLPDGGVNITSHTIESFDWDTKGLTCEKYLEKRFDNKIIGTINGLIDSLEKKGTKIAGIGASALRAATETTLGKLGKRLLIPVDSSLRYVRVIDFACKLVRNMFAGDEPYVRGTPEYELFRAVFTRFAPIIKIAQAELADDYPPLADIPGFVFSLIGDEKQLDNNALLDINWKKYLAEDK